MQIKVHPGLLAVIPPSQTCNSHPSYTREFSCEWSALFFVGHRACEAKLTFNWHGFVISDGFGYFESKHGEIKQIPLQK